MYGLIFLFKWREDDPDKQEPSCPEGVWFANQVGDGAQPLYLQMILTLTQTVDNACASVALLNIVNNISNADLGEHLRRFKEFTRTFTPALRGDAIGNFEFVKQIHNSFARLVRCLDLTPLFLLYYKQDSGHALPGDDVTNTSWTLISAS